MWFLLHSASLSQKKYQYILPAGSGTSRWHSWHSTVVELAVLDAVAVPQSPENSHLDAALGLNVFFACVVPANWGMCLAPLHYLSCFLLHLLVCIVFLMRLAYGPVEASWWSWKVSALISTELFFFITFIVFRSVLFVHYFINCDLYQTHVFFS